MLDKLKRKIKETLPTKESLSASKWTKWMAPYLGDRKLWHWSRRGVSIGVAVGIFFGLLIPVAQIPAAGAVAIVLRANIPAAAASTLVTNPITFAPVYWVAYELGNKIFEAAGIETRDAEANSRGGVNEKEKNEFEREGSENKNKETLDLKGTGGRLIMGLGILAVLLGGISYGATSLIWAWKVRRKRKRSLSSRRMK